MRSLFTFAKACVFPILAFVLLTACGEPADPEGASRRIASSHELRAGASENRPWIWFEGEQVRGPEAALVEDFAGSLGAHVRWTRGAETPLTEMLAARKLDVVAGGFKYDTLWSAKAGTSRPYAGDGLFQQGHILLTATGENQLLLRLDRFLAQRKSRSHD
jgi:polar amino acid transport system substrate-binding protein